MIKFKADGAAGLVVGFGLSELNLERLRAGAAIVIDLRELVGVEGRALIFYGRTEADMVRELEAHGKITPDTITNFMPGPDGWASPN